MRFKEEVLKIVREQNPIDKGLEWKAAKAEYIDAVSLLREQLTVEQCSLLDNILQSADELLRVREEWTFYKTFDEVTKAWRTLILDEDYCRNIEELME